MNKKIYLITSLFFLVQLVYSQNIEKSNTNKHILTLSNENVEPEQVIAEQQLENPMIQPIALDDEKELAIGEMFKENSSQNNANNDNIVLDNELSQELDQYLNNLDLPNS